MINGESYKVIVAEAAKNALAECGGEIFERVFITHPLMDGDKCVGAVGFSVRENKFYVFKAKAVTPGPWAARCTCSSPGPPVRASAVPGIPPFNSGSSAYFTIIGRRRDDLPGSPLHPRPLQGRLRPRRRLVPALQVHATNAWAANYMQDNARAG
jgi:adenylylsulfate reductase subunit A